MPLIYKVTKEGEDDEYCTLSELAEKHHACWTHALGQEAAFWGEIRIIDLLAEASDNFESILADKGIYLEPLNSLDGDDLNILLSPLW